MGWLGIFDSRNLEVQHRTRDVWGGDHFDLEVMTRENQSLTLRHTTRVSLQRDHRFVLEFPEMTLARDLFVPVKNFVGILPGGRQGPWRVVGLTPGYELSHDSWCEVLIGFTDPESFWIKGWVSHKVLFTTLVMNMGKGEREWL